VPIVASHLSEDKIEALAFYLTFIDRGKREAMKSYLAKGGELG
jgi:hypothetical protein